MKESIYQYLASDHDRLDTLLQQAEADPNPEGTEAYEQFRAGLLRHIGIEEKIVLPAISRFRQGQTAQVAARLRLDHGAIVSLLVPLPSPAIFANLRAILSGHNAMEEAEDGIYKLIDTLAGEDVESLLQEIHDYPQVPVLPCKPLEEVLGAVKRAVERGGYEWVEGEKGEGHL